LSNEKRALGCLGHFWGDGKLPSYVGIVSNTMIRIPVKEPVYWKGKAGFFVVAQIMLG